MSSIFGLAGLSASDYQFMRQADQNLIYSAVQMYMQRVNADMAQAASVFIQETTQVAKERYQLPGTGRMNARADGVRGPARRAYGYWDVAYPLLDFGEQVAATDVEFAYMTPDEFDRHVQSVVNAYQAEMRWQILHALLDGVQETFVDPKLGSLTVEHLANGDAVLYPPVLGSDTEATENHYLESGYASASISDTNNPVYTLVNELEEHFGAMTGNSNIVVFHNNAETAKLQDLTDFIEVPDNFVMVGDNADVPTRLPSVPGRVIGRANGAWLAEWRWMPANYMLAVHLEQPAPLKMRVDPSETGLPQGLALVSRDAQYPLVSSEWRARFGVAVGNRLNGAVMELGTGGTYTVPTAYT